MKDAEPTSTQLSIIHFLRPPPERERRKTKQHPESNAVVSLIISLCARESLVWLIHRGVHNRQFIRKCSKATPPHHRRHRFMCYITLITPLSRGWRKLDSVLVPGCPHQAAPLLGLKGSAGGSQTAGVATVTTSRTKWAACLMFTQLFFFFFPNEKTYKCLFSPPKLL